MAHYLVCHAREKGIAKLRFGSALVSQRDYVVTNGLRSQSEVVLDDVIEEWRALWRDRYDDKVKAEAMANRDFALLHIDKGTVIAASRTVRSLDLRSILKDCVVAPHPSVGGWQKFVRTSLIRQSRVRVPKRSSLHVRRKTRQRKKGGRGWLHRRLSE